MKLKISETKLRGIIKNAVQNALNESSMNRISDYVKNYECAMLTAWRNTYTDETDNTFKPNHIYHNKTKTSDGRNVGRGVKHQGQPIQSGENFSTEEKKYYNRELKASLLRLGYGVTQVRGSYKEYGQNESQEGSLFVVNLKNDTNFKKNIFKLSEYYNQDSFMYSPKGTDEGFLIGTNNAEFPGYGKEVPSGKFKRDIQSMFMSRIGNKGFSFTNGEKISNSDSQRDVKFNDGDNNYETDSPLAFSDRKQLRMNESIGKILNLDTFDRYSINGKHAIALYSSKLKNIL